MSLIAQRTITGLVLDEKGEPMPGAWASHREYPTNDEVAWVSLEGTYSLTVPEDCEKLYYSFEWLFEAPLGESDTLNVVLVYGYYDELKQADKPCQREYPIRVSGAAKLEDKQVKCTVQVKNTGVSVETDARGNFSLIVPPMQDVLVFSADRHVTAEIRLAEMQPVYIPMRMHLKMEKKRKWWQIFKRRK